MRIQNGSIPSMEQLTDEYLKSAAGSKSTATTQSGMSFGEIFAQRQQLARTPETVQFSKHAANRLSERQITLSGDQMDRLQMGTQKASEKGIRESLMLMDGLAFIVNVKNNTVVTAMDQNETSENVFTNIDGAVIL